MTTCLALPLLLAPLAVQDTVGGQPYVALETRAATLERMRALLLPSEAEWGAWHLLGPFPFEDFEIGALAEPLAPEAELARLAANGPGPDLAAAYAGEGGREVRWTPLGFVTNRRIELRVHEDDELDDWSVAYLHTTVRVERAAEVEVRMGSDDGLRFWWNGELLVDADVPRGLDVSDHELTLSLRPGVNHVLAKVSQGVGDWAFQLEGEAELDAVADARLQYFLDRDFPPSRERAHYEVVTVPVPEDVVLEVGGLDVLPDGRPVVATRRGDVYLVEGAYAAPPEAARFELFASGLHEPLGAEVVPHPEGGTAVLAAQRGELTRLVDADGDGRAELYATASDAWGVSGNYHEFAFGPKLDADGNAWVTLCVGFCGSLGKSNAPHRGWALKITPEGEAVPVCDGLRSPNGIGFNAEGVAFYVDNQGDYVATNKLAHLAPGSWHGHPASLRWRAGFDPDERPPRQPPAVWFPYRRMGQSAADIALDDTGGAFGPFAGQLFVGDQTLATVMRVFLEEVEGHWQGACFPFLERLDCGVNRLAFAPDGSLFVGQTDRGWGSVGRRPYGLQRVRFTGATPFEVLAVRARADGFELELTQDVDPSTATDPASYAVESHTYDYHAEYGAPEVRAARHAVLAAELVGPRRVRLVLDELRAGFVHELVAHGLRSAAGEPLLHAEAYYTLVRVPGRGEGAEQRADLPRVLFLTHSAGYRHAVVERPRPHVFAPAEERLVEAARGRLTVLPTQDCAKLDPARIDEYDAIVLYTTGELPVEPEAREALVRWVRDGGALVGVHCATDTFYEFPPYQAMLGGVFDGHPWHEEVGALVVDAEHPATGFLAPRFELEDEIYQFRAFDPEPLRVLLRLDPESVALEEGGHPETGYPLAWCRDWGEGRVFYTALGHGEGTWRDERFLEHLVRGIEWAARLGEDAGDGPRPAPPGAALLLSGADLSGWAHRGGGAARWRLADGELEVVPGTGDLVSRAELGDAWIHVEFRVPESPPDARGQARGNSGVYLQGRYELQVLDSWGLEPGPGDCGALYGVAAPDSNATRPAGAWQSYDVRLRAPRFDASGTKVESARVTAWLNGVPIHADVELPGPTPGGLEGEAATGPLLLQDHGHPVRYRAIWAVPLD